MKKKVESQPKPRSRNIGTQTSTNAHRRSRNIGTQTSTNAHPRSRNIETQTLRNVRVAGSQTAANVKTHAGS